MSISEWCQQRSLFVHSKRTFSQRILKSDYPYESIEIKIWFVHRPRILQLHLSILGLKRSERCTSSTFKIFSDSGGSCSRENWRKPAIQALKVRMRHCGCGRRSAGVRTIENEKCSTSVHACHNLVRQAGRKSGGSEEEPDNLVNPLFLRPARRCNEDGATFRGQ